MFAESHEKPESKLKDRRLLVHTDNGDVMKLRIDESHLNRHSRANDSEALESWVHIMQMARAFDEVGDTKMAEEFFRTALWISDEFLSAETSMNGLLMLASTLSKEGRSSEAAIAFMRALRMFDENMNN